MPPWLKYAYRDAAAVPIITTPATAETIAMCPGSAKKPPELWILAVVTVLVERRGLDVAATKAAFANDIVEVSEIPTLKVAVAFFVTNCLVVVVM